MIEHKRLNISFSGGRTSAIMTKLCLERYSDEFDIIVTFANTSCEHPETYKFIQNCDKYWNFNTVWLEGIVTHDAGVGMRAKVTNAKDYKRNGEIFEEVIKKYGIPNQQNPHCTGRMKEEVMLAYLRDIAGWETGSYYTAIGIRADEYDRMSSKAKEKKFIYPLVYLGYDIDKVKNEMQKASFDLEIPGDHYGNCITCWKKSYRKLFTIAKENPHYFDWSKDMEAKYSKIKVNEGFENKVFYRQKHNTEWILEESKKPFKMYKDVDINGYQSLLFEESLEDWKFWEKESSCGSSCEIGADE